MKIKILLSLMLLCFISCKNSDKVERENQPDIYGIKETDKEMNEAIEKANKTLADFNSALINPKIEVKALKVKFQNETDVEHIWINDVKFIDGKYSGILDNEPEYIKGHKIGDTINVDTKDISDWMYIENGKLFGGYTIKVLRNQMSDSERKQFDAESGMQID
ncbi:YegJ family protein [Flavobacterium sp. LAR06]|uniref:YegJ family protein n=1 Tax=Flavobacterium sp. LAR06 TaxID=3064897 RepID=UPI0035C088F4